MAVLVDRHNDEKYRSRRPVPNDFNYFLPKKKNNYCFSILLLLNKIELKEKSGHVVVSLIQFFFELCFAFFFFFNQKFSRRCLAPLRSVCNCRDVDSTEWSWKKKYCAVDIAQKATATAAVFKNKIQFLQNFHSFEFFFFNFK